MLDDQQRMRKMAGACVLAALLCASLLGCATRHPRKALPTPGNGGVCNQSAVAVTNVTGSAGEPRIRTGLVISVAVLAAGKKEVDEPRKQVSAQGDISLPLVGAVVCAGLTPGEFSKRLETLYSEYIRDPQVAIGFVYDNSPGSVSPWGSVTVLGRVKQPGSINIPPTHDLTVSRAIQLAGGLDTSARDTAIRVTHRTADGTTQQVTVDLKNVGSSGDASGDLQVEAGDVVYVPEHVF